MEESKAVQMGFDEALAVTRDLRKRAVQGDALELRSPEERALVMDALLLMENEIQNEREYRMAGQDLNVTGQELNAKQNI